MRKIFSLLIIALTLSSVGVDTVSAQRRGRRNARLEADLKAKAEQEAALKAAQEAAAQLELEAALKAAEEAAAKSVDNGLNIAVILPFNLASTNVGEDKSQMRSVEFYQGFLLAVNQAQAEGIKITVQTYDIGTRGLDNILSDEALTQAQVIVAPINSKDVQQVALYGEEHSIEVISPFTINKELRDKCPHLFQMNTSYAELYDRLNEAVMSYFRMYQLVFVTDSLFQNDLDPYPATLKSAMEAKGIPYYTYTYNEPYSVVTMDSALNLMGQNVLYVMETPQEGAMRRFFPSLKNKLFLDANPALAEAIGATYASGNQELGSSVSVEDMLPKDIFTDTLYLTSEDRQVAILGYPKWQLSMESFMEFYYDLNIWMFTKFYANPFDEEVRAFYDDFKFWYNREPMRIDPKYGLLGYDVATYTIHRLNLFGTLANKPDEAPVRTLQSAINFQQDGEGCYMNKGLYLVHFTPDACVERIEIK